MVKIANIVVSAYQKNIKSYFKCYIIVSIWIKQVESIARFTLYLLRKLPEESGLANGYYNY